MAFRLVLLLPAVLALGQEAESVMNEKISPLVTPAWVKYFTKSRLRSLVWVTVRPNLSNTIEPMTLDSWFAVMHFLVSERPIESAVGAVPELETVAVALVALAPEGAAAEAVDVVDIRELLI